MVIPSGINQQDDMNIGGKRRIPDFSDSLFKENCQIAFMGISMAMGSMAQILWTSK